MSLQAPKPKKQKVEDAAAAAFADAAEQDSGDETNEVKAQRNDSDEAFFELTDSKFPKRVTVRQFKGKTLVDIREVRCSASVCGLRLTCIECVFRMLC
jgi:hypothetical protein